MKKRRTVKDEIKSLNIQTKKIRKKKQVPWKWVITITALAFFISFGFSFASETVIPNVPTVFGVILVFAFISIGILFDMIGVAVASADEKPFHSMNSRKVKGADVAVKFKKNAAKVSTFCNDVIGDICGVISGSAGAIIAVSLSELIPLDRFFITLLVMAIISALTIGGKAMGKNFAMNKSNLILFEFARFISYFYKPKK